MTDEQFKKVNDRLTIESIAVIISITSLTISILTYLFLFCF